MNTKPQEYVDNEVPEYVPVKEERMKGVSVITRAALFLPFRFIVRIDGNQD